MEKVLLVFLFLFQALALGGIGWHWWKLRTGVKPVTDSGPSLTGEELRREMRSLERYIEAKFDLLLAQMLAPKPEAQGLDLKELAVLLGVRETSAPAPAPAEAPALPAGKMELEGDPVQIQNLPRPSRHEDDETSGAGARLAKVLDSNEFRTSVWTDMSGPFEAACGKLLTYLSAIGLAEPEIEPFPPLVNGASNHWLFLVVALRDSQAAGPRLLLPRNYSLYDPMHHDHLFKLLGTAAGKGEPFIRDLRQCAVLEPIGALEGFISTELVVRRGIFVA